jgi:hypothetical protein
MELIHVEGSYEIFTNEGEIALEDKTKEKKCERIKTLPSSLSNNDETLHLIMKKLHEQRFS